MDDVLNVSGHRLGTAEIESALVAHPACVEAAVIGIPHDIKGQGVFAYCILKEGVEETADLRQSLRRQLQVPGCLRLQDLAEAARLRWEGSPGAPLQTGDPQMSPCQLPCGCRRVARDVLHETCRQRSRSCLPSDRF